MAIQHGAATRTAAAQAIADELAGGTIKLFSGAVPANCAAADPAGELASGSLPSPCMTAAAGVLSLTGTWSFTGSAAGNAASFRLYSAGAVCEAQGDVTATGGGGVMEISEVAVTIGRAGSVTAYSETVGGA